MRALRAADSSRSLAATGADPPLARGTVAESDLALLVYIQIRACNSVVAASSGRKTTSSRPLPNTKDSVLVFRSLCACGPCSAATRTTSTCAARARIGGPGDKAAQGASHVGWLEFRPAEESRGRHRWRVDASASRCVFSLRACSRMCLCDVVRRRHVRVSRSVPCMSVASVGVLCTSRQARTHQGLQVYAVGGS